MRAFLFCAMVCGLLLLPSSLSACAALAALPGLLVGVNGGLTPPESGVVGRRGDLCCNMIYLFVKVYLFF